MKFWATFGVPLVLLTAAALGGCKSKPISVSIAELQDPARLAELAPLYWDVDGSVASPASLADEPKIAVTSFAVEFVTAKREQPFDRQPIIGVPAVSPTVLALELTGIGRKRVLFGESLELDVAALLQSEVRQFLERNGEARVVLQGEVRDAEAYRAFNVSGQRASNAIEQLNFFTTDTGQIRATETVAAPGYELISGTKSGEDVDAVEARLLEELGLDASVRVQFRVGMYRGLATIEQGSKVSILTRTGRSGTLEMRRSLLSDEIVQQHGNLFAQGDGGYVPLQGERQQIVDDAYSDQMAVMLPVALKMMFYVMETEGRQGIAREQEVAETAEPPEPAEPATAG